MTESPSPLRMLLFRHTRRWEFIAILGAAAALWPISADAQQLKTRVAGLVFSGSADGFAHLLVALRQGLRDRGDVEGKPHNRVPVGRR
jgi:putative ABC transport system substrate-binding protein